MEKEKEQEKEKADTTKTFKIIASKSRCCKILIICDDIQKDFKEKVTLKIKLNSEKSKYSYLSVFNNKYTESSDTVCLCSDFINSSNICRMACNGEIFIGPHNLLSLRNPISEKLNFQESMITITLDFDFKEEFIIIKDSKNKEIFKVPLPTGIECSVEEIEEMEKLKIFKPDEFFKNLKFYIGISSCDLEEDDDFICKIIL